MKSAFFNREVTAKRYTGDCTKFAKQKKIEAADALIREIDMESNSAILNNSISRADFYRFLELSLSLLTKRR